ncbi:MAG: [FeFe] hydrogenase H-cluster maturation GTPase HydF [Candidatus Aceula meridiana]|nr:[FeFe] hydrogenase H-cluster maturation GTPase HydF [Candidatus Aceula meridiana]
MENTPKSLRLHIGLFGRTNVGKSSFLNMVTGQDVSIISHHPGTTTDVVEKTMELLPIGPVVFLDTAGIDDESVLAKKRIEKTKNVFRRADVVLLILEPNKWTEFEVNIAAEANKRNTPLIVVVNKVDSDELRDEFLEKIKEYSRRLMFVSSIRKEKRDEYVNQFKVVLIEATPDDFLVKPFLIGDLLPKNGLAMLIVPIDLEAPKGRIILPQVQTIRDALDNDASAWVVKESEYAHALKKLKTPPDIVICDSQVVDKMVAETPEGINCTTFSILFARFKSDLVEMARGAVAIESLMSGDKILILEGCTHHAIEDDIGRVKIPRWLKEYTQADLKIDVFSGRDLPENIKEYKLIIQCGSCMLNRKESVYRIEQAKANGVPITNYGVCISYTQGVLERVLEPFKPASLVFAQEIAQIKKKKVAA